MRKRGKQPPKSFILLKIENIVDSIFGILSLQHFSFTLIPLNHLNQTVIIALTCAVAKPAFEWQIFDWNIQGFNGHMTDPNNNRKFYYLFRSCAHCSFPPHDSKFFSKRWFLIYNNNLNIGPTLNQLLISCSESLTFEQSYFILNESVV